MKLYPRRKFTFHILFCLITGYTSSAQIITTFAGNGSFSVLLTDGVPATSVGIATPLSMSLEKNKGDIYFANGWIRKINEYGIISSVAVVGHPTHIMVDDTGSLYITILTGYNIIQKIDTFGVVTTFAGASYGGGYNGDGIPATAALLHQAVGIASDKFGNIFIADGGNNRVRRVRVVSSPQLPAMALEQTMAMDFPLPQHL